MTGLRRALTQGAAGVLLVLTGATVGQVVSTSGAAAAPVVRAALAPGTINNVLVIQLENEGATETFGPGSVATYLNGTLVPKGELLQNYYATGHVSLDNYIAEISGQAPTPLTDSDCNLTGYSNVTPGTDDPNTAKYPGQVDGNGCIFPAPTATTTGAPTIADQLDAASPPNPTTHVASWREYAEDMGNDPTRDGGVADPLGGTDCAHPTVGGTDGAAVAEASDRYATRHNPFMYFHSVIDNTAECDANVVPLGKATVGTPSTFNSVSLPDTFTGHLANDLSSTSTTPKFGFITPNLCDDGHDATCAGTNVEGGNTGGLTAADLWLKHWMPLIMASPSYQSGQMLVVLTSDEADVTDTSACCNEQPGPNWAFPGHSPLLGAAPTTPGADPGGGRIGALLLNADYIVPGTVDTTGFYNHYSALRSYEDLLGLTTGGVDGEGHLGFAAATGLTPFGQDIFQPNQAPTITTNPQSQSVVTGGSLTFTAAADVTTPSIQWQASVNGGGSWFNVSGATNPSLTVNNLNSFVNGWEVRAVFTNHAGAATSSAATISVTAPATSVTLPSNNATVSGSAILDALGIARGVHGALRAERWKPHQRRDRHRHPDHLRLAGALEHHHGGERDIHAVERGVFGRPHGHEPGHRSDRQQPTTGDRRRPAVEQRHGVGVGHPRRAGIARGDHGALRAERWKPHQRRDRHRHADHLRLGGALEHHHGSERDIHAAERGLLRRRRQRHQRSHHHFARQLMPAGGLARWALDL